jgi:transcriptional regulator with XRE-family HTH domain
MTAQSTAFAVLLKRFRGRAGLTQETLAERAGLSVTGISKIERGIHPSPHCDTIHLLADALGLSPDDRAALEQAACQSAIPSPWLRDGQTVSLGAVLQAISSLAGLSGGDQFPPTAHSA